MPLDETKNESYKYLRSVGNNWKYNPDSVHPKILARLFKRFDTFDLDNDDIMTLDEVLQWPERMKHLAKASDEQIGKMKDAIYKFFLNKGVDPIVGLKREDWIETNRVFAEAERERERRGEGSLIANLSNAYYDALDDDGDGNVDIQELRTMMKAFDVPLEAAYTFFTKVDEGNAGMLQRPQLVHIFKKFWMEKYDEKWEDLYAYKY